MHFAPGDLPGILAAAAVYFVVNNALMAVALAFAQRVPILRYLLDDLPFQALAAGVLLSLSPAVVVAGDFSPLLIPLLALPLVAVHRSASASLENARLVSELEESLTRLADQAAENEYLAFHDALTSLPNRILFRDRVEAATRLAQREGSVAAVMIMDLDHFKEINDTLGHDHGDALLKQLGTRLRSVLRKSDTLARMGGDEFGILLPSVSGRDGAVRVADKVRRALEKPFDVDGMALEVSGTIGISLFPEHGGSVDKLIQRADVAMYWGKAAHTGYEFYDHRKDRYSPSRLSLVARLRQALEARELILHYQPKVELRTGEIRGVEALVRWRHPKRGLVPPGEFLPLTERTGLIGPLTSYVLNASLGKCRALRLAGFELAVAVNLSARNLSDAELPDEIAGLLARWQLPASALEVEITETSIMADPGRAIDVLGRLRRLGVVVSLDDFGTGYSSLAFLRQLPIDEIKIDRSFVSSMIEEEDDAVIVRSTIDLGRNLGLRVVAEGVETEAAWDRLKELRCDLAQGYFIGEPIPSEDLARWLESVRGRHRTIRPRLRLARAGSISRPARRQPPAAVS